MQESHHELINYLCFLQQHLHIRLTIKDRCGWMHFLPEELSMALIPFALHSHPCCKFIKSNPRFIKRCSAMNDLIERALLRNHQPIYGFCHAGIGEFAYPFFNRDRDLIGFVTAGGFRAEGPAARTRYLKKVRRGGLSESEALGCYAQLLPEGSVSMETIRHTLGICAQYMSFLYDQYVPEGWYRSRIALTLGEDGCLEKILEMVHSQYTNPLTVSDIAKYCCYSASYISHLFKKRTGVNIRAYINWLRIEKAKKLLRHPHDSISQVARSVGFDDADYFSRVFYSIVQCSPSHYRKRYRG